MNTRSLSFCPPYAIALGCLLLAVELREADQRRPPAPPARAAAAPPARRPAAASARRSRRQPELRRLRQRLRQRPVLSERHVQLRGGPDSCAGAAASAPTPSTAAAATPARAARSAAATPAWRVSLGTDDVLGRRVHPGQRRRHDRALWRLQRLPGRRERLQQRRLRLHGQRQLCGSSCVEHEHEQHPLRRLQPALHRRQLHERRLRDHRPAPPARPAAPAPPAPQAPRHAAHRQRRGGTTGTAGTTGSRGPRRHRGRGRHDRHGRHRRQRLGGNPPGWWTSGSMHGCPWTGIDVLNVGTDEHAPGLHDQDRLVRDALLRLGHRRSRPRLQRRRAARLQPQRDADRGVEPVRLQAGRRHRDRAARRHGDRHAASRSTSARRSARCCASRSRTRWAA